MRTRHTTWATRYARAHSSRLPFNETQVRGLSVRATAVMVESKLRDCALSSGIDISWIEISGALLSAVINVHLGNSLTG